MENTINSQDLIRSNINKLLISVVLIITSYFIVLNNGFETFENLILTVSIIPLMIIANELLGIDDRTLSK